MKYLGLVVIILAFLTVIFVIDYEPKVESTPIQESLLKGPCDSLIRALDSLEMNYKIMEDNFMRYEATLDLLEEKNPDAAYEFEKIYFDLYE